MTKCFDTRDRSGHLFLVPLNVVSSRLEYREFYLCGLFESLWTGKYTFSVF